MQPKKVNIRGQIVPLHASHSFGLPVWLYCIAHDFHSLFLRVLA